MRVLVAGIGNIFHGDDAFGMEVAGVLSRRNLPPEVRVADFGTRGFDLAYALLDAYDVAILVAAISHGEPPGSLFTLEIDPEAAGGPESQDIGAATHGINPMRVLHMARSMGGCQGWILMVACEPETFGTAEEGQMGLSATVAAVVEPAANLVHRIIEKLLRANTGTAAQNDGPVSESEGGDNDGCSNAPPG